MQDIPKAQEVLGFEKVSCLIEDVELCTWSTKSYDIKRNSYTQRAGIIDESTG